jgi:hypothetical protein
MELQAFDLLWLPEPIDFCVHDDTALQFYESELDLRIASGREAFVVLMAHCDDCGQWYGLLPVLDEIMNHLDLDAGQVEGFRLENEPVTAGVHFGPSSIPWSTFGEQMTSMKAAQEQPTPTVEEVQALDQSPTTWELATGPAAWIGEEDEEPELSYVALVHGPNLVRSLDISVGNSFDAAQLAALIRRAAGTPQPPGRPGRPRTVRLSDPDLASALDSHLAPLDIDVEVDDTPLATEALDEMTAQLARDIGPPLFRNAEEATLRTFLDTAARFYENEPWKRTEGDRYLGVKIDGDDWFFANVMGQIDENPGLSVFDEWLTLCRFIHNQRSGDMLGALADLLVDDERRVDPFEAAGAMEALSLYDRDMLHPADIERLDALSIDPPVNGRYPVPRRFEFEAGPTQPHFSLDTYRRTIDALLIALERRTATPVTSIKTTLDIDGTEVSLRYPSDGTERPHDGPPGYRLVLSGHDSDMSSPSRLSSGEQLVIDAPATALFKDVAKTVTRAEDSFYEFTLYERNVCLWDDHGSRRNPSPRVADLTELEEMDVEVGGVTFPFRIDRALDTAPDEIHVERVAAG